MSMNISLHDDDAGTMKAEHSGIIPGTAGNFICVHLYDPHSEQKFSVYSHQSQSLRRIADAFIKAADELDADKDRAWRAAAVPCECGLDDVGPKRCPAHKCVSQ